MLKILRIIFLLALYFKATFAKNSEFEIGVGTSMANYYVDTSAQSILNWQHLKSYDLKLATKMKLDNGVKLILEANYSYFNKGEMSDDDIENYALVQGMIYSKTRYLKGYSIKLDGLIQSNVNQNLDFLFGARHDKKLYKPKFFYQLAYTVDDGVAGYSDVESQHIEIETYGPTLGFSLAKASSDMKIKLTFLGYIPFKTKVQASKWGEEDGVKKDPRWEGDFLKTYGFDTKLETMFAVTDSHWMNLYTVFEYMKSTKLKETVFNRNNGKSNQNIHKKVSFGVSVIF